MDIDSLISQLIPVAREAGEAIMEVYAKDVSADFKQDGSPVTEADNAAEAIIIPALTTIAPDITIISEENAASHSVAPPERFFLVDPLDGTKEFLKRDGKGSFTVNIALIEKGSPIAGVVYAPALGRLFVGNRDGGAHEIEGGTFNAISIRAVPDSGAIAVASASHRDDKTNQWLDDHSIIHTTSIGSSLKFCLLAAGEADVYPRFGPTMEWDTAAGDAVLRAAGGQIKMPDGSPFSYGKPDYRNGSFIAYGGYQSS